MLYRVFIVSNLAVVLGLLLLFLGDYLTPSLAQFTMPAGALLAGISGLVFVASGIGLIWADGRT